MKKYFLGLLSGIFLMISIPVFAETTMNIVAGFDKVKIMVDGNMTDIPTLLYEGRTYIQLRGVADIFGTEIDWDSNTYTAKLYSANGNNQQSPQPQPQPQPAEQVTLPVPETKEMPKVYKEGSTVEIGEATIKIIDTYRTEEVRESNGSGFLSQQGHEFYAIDMEILTDALPQTGRYWLSISFVDHIKTSDGIVYNQPSTLGGMAEIYPGSKTRVTVYISILKNEKISEIHISDGMRNTAIVNVE